MKTSKDNIISAKIYLFSIGIVFLIFAIASYLDWPYEQYVPDLVIMAMIFFFANMYALNEGEKENTSQKIR